jgi:GPH family glycoside/pentoside/hexuronide:cation symporter
METAKTIQGESKAKFGIKDKIGYMFGDFGNDFFFILASAFLMIFYTDVFGLSPKLVGLVFLLARVWDAFMDVLWGRFIDSRATTKHGKFKPWIIRMAPFLVFFGVLMFTKIPGLPNQFYLIYALSSYIIWGSLYSTVNIPYGAMASVITGNDVERASLSTFRSIGANIAGVVVGVVVPLVVFVNNKPDSTRFFLVAVAFAVLAMICYSLCYFLSTERIIQTEAHREANKVGMGKTLATLMKNKPFIAFVSASLIMMITMLLQQAVNTYMFKDYYGNAKVLSFFNLLSVFSIIVVAPLVAPIIKKFGKKEAGTVAMLYSSVVYFLLAFIPVSNVYFFIVLMFIGNLGFYLFNFTLWAFVTDVIDYQEYLSGTRQDGTIYSIYSFTRKVGQALAGGLGGYALGALGYVKAPKQTLEVATNIKEFALLAPAVGYLLIAIILLVAYPMTKKKLTQLASDLAANRAAKKDH